jgi:hypothetical protein
MRRSTSYVLALAIAAAFVGCGKDEGSVGEGSFSEGSKNTDKYAIHNPDGSRKTAKETTAEWRDDLDCPVKVSSKRDEGAPVDDIQGVRPGMTFNEAVEVVLCSNEDIGVTINDENTEYFDVISRGIFTGNGERKNFFANIINFKKTDEHGNSVNPDKSPLWKVQSIGVPKEESIVAVNYIESYYNGKNPSIESVKQALISKYGNNVRVKDGYMIWAYDTLNRPITETSPLNSECFNISTTLMEGCGLKVIAYSYPLDENPLLSSGLNLTVVNPAKGAQLIEETKQKFSKLEAARHEKELKNTQDNSEKPSL